MSSSLKAATPPLTDRLGSGQPRTLYSNRLKQSVRLGESGVPQRPEPKTWNAHTPAVQTNSLERLANRAPEALSRPG